ncbi:hypothetical protein Tb11.03.0420 [Trypanosoma brucei brucei TREU927]|uniref:Uncharacterized protein n=1 Tax=Trypanosoma brucei brucei (strain 927/4 GUTat10.1) TaxID=185431 RepID=Q387H7_TRYB2|nr:hypothetical protein Tb11.03.0420 [Trypanosoma brucei brucei TREU927]EAN79054.1 hypothetical protein Tb11.03.0420 [Trypanosoma brucei brucei TREU927]
MSGFSGTARTYCARWIGLIFQGGVVPVLGCTAGPQLRVRQRQPFGPQGGGKLGPVSLSKSPQLLLVKRMQGVEPEGGSVGSAPRESGWGVRQASRAGGGCVSRGSVIFTPSVCISTKEKVVSRSTLYCFAVCNCCAAGECLTASWDRRGSGT